MNDKPTINPQTLPPLTRFIYTLGQLPTSYLMSMSFEEQLVWLCNYLGTQVIPAVNQNGEAVEELQNLYELLRTYVNDYFDNLNVQEEINNKLEEMAQDGSLYNIIKTYTDPIVNQQNARITSVENQVSSVASGSPLVASSTSGMTDTTKTYVNTTDGKWYYYDGDSWEIGGTYQSTELANNSVSYEKLESELKNTFRDVTNTTNIQRIIQKILNTSGGIIDTSNDWSIYQLDVVPNETYKLHIQFNTTQYTGIYAICIGLFNNSTMISSILPEDVTIDENNMYDLLLNIPNNVNKVVINTRNDTSNILTRNKSYILKVNNYEVKDINKNQLDSKLQTLFNDQYEEIEIPVPYIQNAFFYDSGIVASYNGTNIHAIEVTPGEKYKITAKQVYGNPILAFTGNNYNKTITISDNDYIFNNMIEFIKNETQNYQYEDYEFTVPNYCTKIYVSVFANDTSFKIKKSSSYKVDASNIIQNYNKIGFSNWIAIGDSITEVNYRALHNYLYWVKNDIPDITITNKGISGTGYMNGNNTFVQRIESINSYNLATDIITVMGSINDIQHVGSSLGELGDTTTSTLYGSMYQFFTQLFTKFNGVRIGCISPINWKDSQNSNSLKLYVKALKETCELFNVPFLDMTTNTNLRPNNDTFLTTYYTADGTGNTGQVDTGGVHPNSNGHRLFYARIKEFINTL